MAAVALSPDPSSEKRRHSLSNVINTPEELTEQGVTVKETVEDDNTVREKVDLPRRMLMAAT